jgi:hypothetical protein
LICTISRMVQYWMETFQHQQIMHDEVT